MLKCLFFLDLYWFWILFVLLVVGMMLQVLILDSLWVFYMLVYFSGEFVVCVLIIVMMVMLLVLLFKGWFGLCWFKKNCCYFGVVVFGYVVLYMLFYLIDKLLMLIVVVELLWLYIWMGWIVFLIFVLLVVMLMDYFVCVMGFVWK